MSTEARRVCPTCGYEYEDWVEVCPDCETPVQVQPAKLEVVRRQLGDDDNPEWTVVGNVPNAIIGNLIKNQIEDAGIPVLMLRSKSADIAEFSHNDFVPHDLRVPRHLLLEARRIIDAPPGGNLMEQDWEDFNAEADESAIGDDEPVRGGLPEGWSVLPTETDIRARQMLRRSMGNAPDGWYWSDRKRKEGVEEGGSYWQEMYDRSAGPGFQRKDAGAYDDEYEDYGPYRNADPYAPNKWVRWFYAILLLVMSLPFIFQLIQTLFSFGQPLP
jgi:hypothetical protein